MGGGYFDSTTYSSAQSARVASGVKDFAYNETATAVHRDLDAKRIHDKVKQILESRDSEEHPDSNAIMICLDVTGSNISRAREVQKSLLGLMETLTKYIPHPQISIAANDDIKSVGANAFQISEFESDNRIDDHIRNLFLTGHGGGNNCESYDLALYAAAYKTSIDCHEKRGRKGYLFIYADEYFYGSVSKQTIKTVFGDNIDQEEIFVTELIALAKEKYHVFVLAAAGSGGEIKQYRELFGTENVIYLERPDRATSVIAATIAFNEKTATPDVVAADLAALGTTSQQLNGMMNDLFTSRTW